MQPKGLEEKANRWRGILLELSGSDPFARTREQDVVFVRAMLATALMREGYPKSHIAKVLGIHHSTAIHYQELMDNILSSPGYGPEREIWERFAKKIEEMDTRKELGEPRFGEKLSPVLSEIENAILDHITNSPGERPHYTEEGFLAAINIFLDVILDKMWLFGDANGWSSEMREAFAEKCGTDLRAFVKRYTGIDTRKAVSGAYGNAKVKNE